MLRQQAQGLNHKSRWKQRAALTDGIPTGKRRFKDLLLEIITKYAQFYTFLMAWNINFLFKYILNNNLESELIHIDTFYDSNTDIFTFF